MSLERLSQEERRKVPNDLGTSVSDGGSEAFNHQVSQMDPHGHRELGRGPCLGHGETGRATLGIIPLPGGRRGLVPVGEPQPPEQGRAATPPAPSLRVNQV